MRQSLSIFAQYSDFSILVLTFFVALKCLDLHIFALFSNEYNKYRAFSCNVKAAILVFQNKEKAAILVYQTTLLGVELYFFLQKSSFV